MTSNNGKLLLGGILGSFNSRSEFRVTFTKGRLHEMRLTHADTGIKRWGFELAALDTATSSVNTGTLLVSDPDNTSIVADIGSREYVEHTQLGTCMTGLECPSAAGCPDLQSWDFQWLAPSSDEAVTFYFCSNAANADCGASGDDRIRCDLVSAVPETEVQVALPGGPESGGILLEWVGGIPDFNGWMRTKPDFDELDGTAGPQRFGGLSGPDAVLPDCGQPLCFYIVE